MAVGFPDYQVPVRPMRPFAGTGQTMTSYYSETAVAAGSNTTITVFTVAAGKQFILSSASICVEGSCIQKFEYNPVGITYMTATFDTFYSFVDSDIGAAAFPATTFLQLRLYNNDTVERTYYVTIWGNEESV